jgi:hypothetical protein
VDARIDLVRTEIAATHEQLLARAEHATVVARHIHLARQPLGGVPEGVQIPAEQRQHERRDAEGTPLGRRVEDAVVLLAHDRTEVLAPATHVAYRRHAANIAPSARG